MKFTVDWLKDHLDTEASNAEIIDTLTMVGLEVEDVEDQAKALAPFVTAYVISAEKHPNADKLKLCKVDTGSGEPVQVVCGAPNARTGMKGVFAAPGSYIPGSDFTLQKGVIRGEASNGMLCSERELLLSEDHDGIIELPEDAPVGVPYTDYAGIDGVVIDIAITPNRGDCTGVYGIARDLAAAGIGELKDGSVKPVPSSEAKTPSIELRFPGSDNPACLMFAGRLVKNIKNGPSPDWLQQRLIAVGLRPINALVDITNYVSLDRGRPLHVYDADKLKGQMHVRMAENGESFLGLDGKTHMLDETMCVVADDNGVLGLGGVLGGEDTGCTEETTNVLIECAFWDPMSIAQTGRKTGIVTDARYRLERNVDPAFVEPGLELATQLVLDFCGGEAAQPYIAGKAEAPETIIDFPLSEIKRLTGLDIKFPEIKAFLTRLGFWVTGTGDVVKVAVPSWRADVEQKADLVEEVMRMAGVDRVPVDPLPRLSSVAPKMLTVIQNRRRIARRALAARGLDEAVTWSFIEHDQAVAFGGGGEDLQLANPIASELTDMRPSLLPGLISAARRNAHRGFGELGLFEVGQVFENDTPEGQHNHATGLRTGTARFGATGRHWRHKAEKVDVFEAKADAAAVLEALGFDTSTVQVVAEPATWSHPGRGGRFQLGPKRIIAWFGEVHPRLLTEMDIAGPVAAFEINLDAIPEPKVKPTKAKPALEVSDLMAVKRDFAFVVDRSVEAAKIVKSARGADKSLITDVTVFDLFEGASLGEDRKSVAIEVTLQPRDKTLTDAEIEAVGNSIVAAVEKATGGTLRG